MHFPVDIDRCRAVAHPGSPTGGRTEIDDALASQLFHRGRRQSAVPLQGFSQYLQLEFPLHITRGVQEVAATAPFGAERRTRWPNAPGVRLVDVDDFGTCVGTSGLRDAHRHVFSRQGMPDKDHEVSIASYTVPTVSDVADGYSHQVTHLMPRSLYLSPTLRRVVVGFAGVIVCGVGHNSSIDFLACSVRPCTS